MSLTHGGKCSTTWKTSRTRTNTEGRMTRKLLTIGGFLATIMLLGMALIMIAAINLVLNGYDPKCGPLPERIWRNAVPFMCSEKPAKPRSMSLRSNPVQPRIDKRATPQPKRATPQPKRSRCAPLQQEPYRVQCNPQTGHCYHDPGYRAHCGIADNWSGK